DVSIKLTVEGQDVLIAVQARDKKRPADINTVGEFFAVLQDINASKGILICNAGFTEGACNLAEHWDIDLCTAHDAESRDWKDDIDIPVLWIDLSPSLNVLIETSLEAGDTLSSDIQDWILSSDRGKTRLNIFSTFIRAWNENRIPKNAGVTHH